MYRGEGTAYAVESFHSNKSGSSKGLVSYATECAPFIYTRFRGSEKPAVLQKGPILNIVSFAPLVLALVLGILHLREKARGGNKTD